MFQELTHYDVWWAHLKGIKAAIYRQYLGFFCLYFPSYESYSELWKQDFSPPIPFPKTHPRLWADLFCKQVAWLGWCNDGRLLGTLPHDEGAATSWWVMSQGPRVPCCRHTKILQKLNNTRAVHRASLTGEIRSVVVAPQPPRQPELSPPASCCVGGWKSRAPRRSSPDAFGSKSLGADASPQSGSVWRNLQSVSLVH